MPALTNNIKKKLKDRLEIYEGRVNYMYQDSKGFVTIGIGHLISSAHNAEALPLRKHNGSVASSNEKRAEYEKIKSLPHGNRQATYYRQYTSLILSDSEIDRLVTLHIGTFHRELRRLFDDFDTYPEEVQLGLFDMIFNLGMTKLRNIFRNFTSTVIDQDWRAAAEESYRRDVNKERNDYVKNLFIKAAETAKAE